METMIDGDASMNGYRDWMISLPFSVPAGDTDGVLTEALFDAALELAPTAARGMTARGDTIDGKVWITFTLVDTSQALANEIASEMRQRIREAVLTDEDACVSAS
jgi:hypothetical protein